jgi:small redox-active disulfide protein 2
MMKQVQILGTGCAKCRQLMDNTRAAAQKLGIDIELQKISDMAEIMKFGVLSTPGLVIDGRLITAGRLLKPDEILPHLR